jgi:hypothetical protein
MNYVENLSFATVSTLAGGLYDAKTASYMGLMFMLGRYFCFNLDCCIHGFTIGRMV